MGVKKVKIVGYTTAEERRMIRTRAQALGMTIGVYLTELCVWDGQHNLIPRLRSKEDIIHKRISSDK